MNSTPVGFRLPIHLCRGACWTCQQKIVLNVGFLGSSWAHEGDYEERKQVWGLIYSTCCPEKGVSLFLFSFFLCWCDDSVAYAQWNKLLRSNYWSKDGAVCLVTFKLWMLNREMLPCSKSWEESGPCSHRSHCGLINISDVSWTHLALVLWTIHLFFLYIKIKQFNKLLAPPSLFVFKDFRKLLKKEERPILMMFYAPCESFHHHWLNMMWFDEIRLYLTLNGEIYK